LPRVSEDFRVKTLANAKMRAAELERIAEFENDLYKFLQAGWKYIDPADFKDGWHLEAIADHLMAVTRGEIQRLIVNIPPRCSKSSLISVCWPAWVWIQSQKGPLSGPHVQFLSASYGHKLSLRDSVKTRRLIQSSWYQRFWKDRFVLTGDVNTKERFENNKGGYRLATSVDGALTGEGGSCFVAGTKISTPNGYKPIEKVQVGNVLVAFDHSRGRVVDSSVTATQSRLVDEVYEFDTREGHTFRCTGNHPIYVPGSGYVLASELRVGSRVIRERGVWGLCPSSDVRQLRRGYQEGGIRASEGPEAGEPGRLLQCGVPGSTLRDKDISPMYRMRRTEEGAAFALLLGWLQRGWAPRQANEEVERQGKVLSRVWDDLCRLEQLLLSWVCRCCAFQANDWFPQLQVQGVGTVLQSVQANGRVDPSSGGTSLRSLWVSRQANEGAEQSQALASSGSPYRREHKEQCPHELDPPVQFLSQKASSWDFDCITRITRNSGKTHRVYDIQVERFSNFFAEGILAHNCIIVDDPHNVTEAESELVRESTIQWWDESMSTRLNDLSTGAYVIVQQRVHQGDLTGHIIDNDSDGWTWLMLPMEYDPGRHCVTFTKNGEKFWEDPRTVDGELLCPDRVGPDELERLKRSMPPYAQAGQLQQQPVPRGGGIIKEEWWQRWYHPLDKEENPTYPAFEFLLASLDTAYTEKEENDASALTIWGIFRDENKNPRLMLVYAWQDRLELNDLVVKIIDTCTIEQKANPVVKNRFPVDRLLIESKASGLSVYQELRRTIGLSGKFGVELYNPSKQGDKVARVYSIQHLFSSGMIYVPWKGIEGFRWVTDRGQVMDQITNFPRGSHDDYVDSMSQALRYLRDMNFALLREEHDMDVAEQMRYSPKLPALYPV
jgi:predicted phage terminase large subunit-like protein